MKIKFALCMTVLCMSTTLFGCNTSSSTSSGSYTSTTTKSSSQKTTTAKCQFKDSNGNRNCTNTATHGQLCDYHYNLLNDTYNSLVGD